MSQEKSLMEGCATRRLHKKASQPVTQTPRKQPILTLLQPVRRSLGLGVALQVVASMCSALTFVTLAQMVTQLLERDETGLGSERGADLLHVLDPAIVVPTAWFLSACPADNDSG